MDRVSMYRKSLREIRLTWNDVTRVHGIFVLNEAKAVHQLDLSDLAGAMGLKVCLDVRFGSIAGQVAQVQAGGGDLGHYGCAKGALLS